MKRDNKKQCEPNDCSPSCRLNEERYPKLTEYYNLLKDRPSIKTSWPPTWLDDPQAKDLLKDI